MPSATDLLGPEGPLARTLGAYEPRQGQLDMAAAVERALHEDRVLLCEAGTGTGKTLAYLVPAILSGRKVVVSTATRALQEQIYFRDLPLIERALGLAPRAALMKGLPNYLCRRRYNEFRASPESLRPAHQRALETLDSFLAATETGDLAELAGLSEDHPIRAEVSSASETRVGPSCPHFDECFVTRMRKEAEAAQIVIVNHYLFFADLALRGPHPGRVIPDYEAVIFDEAHQLEDVATEFFGVRVSSVRVERLLRDAERALRLAGAADVLFGGGSLGCIERVGEAAQAFFAGVRRHGNGRDGRVTLERDAWAGGQAALWHELDDALAALAAAAAASLGRFAGQSARPPSAVRTESVKEALELCERRAEGLREQLRQVVEGAPGSVTWYEGARDRHVLSSSPVDLSHVLRERIFESVPAVVMTSATLATPARSAEDGGERGAFAYFRSRVGLEAGSIDVTELVVPSPFDFERAALLYTPRDLPEPNDQSFLARAADRIRELVEITDGGCFVLTTSLRSMQGLERLLRAALAGRRVLVQGEAPKASLLSRFRAQGDAVLVATSSFWEGVDVPGEALRLVVLEKIPFSVPTDPLVRARSQELERIGENPFMKLFVPAAAIALKQGFGRLIRTRSDAGVVALFDDRIHRKNYGAKLLATLPPAKRSDDLEDVRRFWASRTAASCARV
jgi:ATP-dependent DNA helicase DinG